MLRILDGQHRRADGTLDDGSSPQAITTKEATVASGTFEEKQVAVSRATTMNLLEHNGVFLPWKSSSARIEQTLEPHRGQ